MPSDAEAQELAAGVFGLLSAASLENLSVGRDGAGQWVIEFENRTWRDDIAAVTMAMEQIASVRLIPVMKVLIPAGAKKVVLEAGVRFGWGEVVGCDALFITQDTYGHSAPYQVLMKELGWNNEAIAQRVVEFVGQA